MLQLNVVLGRRLSFVKSNLKRVLLPEVRPTEFPIVGVGASAGGLAAFAQLLACLPVDTGMAFILVQHLDAHHESALAQLLSRNTSMHVREVTERTRVQPNHIYVIPPDRLLAFSRGALILSARTSAHASAHSIDFLFDSLARDQKEKAIGVVLSGSATDGTLGLEAIKAEGGITFAQDSSAKFDSMPRSAIAGGCVDFVLSPEAIAVELARIAKHPYLQSRAYPGSIKAAQPLIATKGKSSWSHVSPADSGFTKILLLLRDRCGVDFSSYKPSTIQRRITRRMVLKQSETIASYFQLLRGAEKEIDALFSDLLIGVTSFFRNRDAFESLNKKALSKIIQQGRVDPIRVWVPGCSSGQEAYSIAMSLVEVAERTVESTPALQIFGTDLNEAMLNKARHGLYPRTLAADLSPERLKRFFVEEEGGYRVSKMLRDACVFARHNLLSDPPFSRMDLISCRNLLIYLDTDSQKKILPTFHYALKPEGLLFLGSSESIGSFTELFEPIDKKQKIYTRKATSNRAVPPATTPREPAIKRKPEAAKLKNEFTRLPAELNAQREADRVVLSQYAPPGVLVDANLKIIQFRGTTSPYLEPPTGKAEFHVLKMACDGLMLPLRAAMEKAKKDDRPICQKNIAITDRGEVRRITLVITPLKNLQERCYLISFEEPALHAFRGTEPDSFPAAKTKGPLPAEVQTPAALRLHAKRVTNLERELTETRDYLQSLQEQHETAHEEIQASTEELQSGNEELQSINEELETSKEELESTNEELITVNDEMAHRNTELTRLNSDLSNLHVSINTAIVVVGRDLTLWRFTSPAEKLFNLMPADLGRPLAGIRHNLVFPELETFISEAIESGTVREREVQDKENHWYLLRIRPYLTVDNQITGAVLVLVDIDQLKQSERATIEALDYAEAILRTARDPLVILRGDLRVNTANKAFYELFKTSANETDGRLIYEVGNRRWDFPKLRALLSAVLPERSVFNDFEVTVEVPGTGPRTLLLGGRQIIESRGGTLKLILLSFVDITEGVKSRAALRSSELRYRRLFEAAQDGILILNSETGEITDVNPFMTKLLGFGREEFLGKELFEIGLLRDAAASQAAFQELKTKGYLRYDYLPLKSKTGERRDVECVANLYSEDGTNVIQCNIRDITERRIAEETKIFLSAIVESCDQSIISLDLNANITSWNRAAELLYGYSAAEALGKPLSTLLLHSDENWVQRHLDCIQRGEAVDPIDTERVRKDGRRVHLSVHLSPIEGLNGKILGVSTIAHDITGRITAENALRESEERFRHLVEDVKDHAIFALDPIGNVLSWNEAAVRTTGYTEAEMVGQPFSRLFSAEDIKSGNPAKELAEALASGRADDDNWMVRKDGGRFWASGVCSAQYDDCGKFAGFVKVVRDESERKQISEALRVSEEKFRTMVETSTDCIEELDIEGRLLSINRAGGSLLEVADVTSRLQAPWLNFWAAEDRAKAETAMENARKGGVGTFEASSPSVSGKGKRWSVIVTPLLNTAEQTTRLMVVSRDVTERKQAEQVLADQAEKLEFEVGERTRQLRDTIGELESFSYSVSHDMRAPLRAMRGFADVLLEENRGQLNAQGLKYLERIAAAANRMDQLIEDVLTYTRVLRSEIQLKPIDLDILVHQIIDTYPQLQTAGVSLEIGTNLPAVIGNEASLLQSLSNLLTNAVKFVAAGVRPKVSITAEEKEGEIRLSIQDNGIGIDPKDHARIFQIYERVHSPESFGGTGIGLAIVRKAIERMNGTVGLESSLGHGSVFWIQLKKA